MALFVDGPASTIDDLTDQDSGLLDVAETNGINVSTKLRLAQEEIADRSAVVADQAAAHNGDVLGPGAAHRADRGHAAAEAVGDDACAGACLSRRLFQPVGGSLSGEVAGIRAVWRAMPARASLRADWGW